MLQQTVTRKLLSILLKKPVLQEEAGVPVDIQDGNALIAAASNGMLHAVKYLAGKGIPVDTQNGEALNIASFQGHMNVIKYLVEEAGVAPNINNGKALIDAASNGQLVAVKYLLSKFQFNEGDLENAIIKSENDTIRALLQENKNKLQST